MTSHRPLAPEQDALRHILARLMDEESNLESLCKHAPRLASVAANIARIQASLQAAAEPDEMDAVRRALRELTDETIAEEDISW